MRTSLLEKESYFATAYSILKRKRFFELEVEQNCASLGCVYPAHGSASNMTVKWLLAGNVLILTPNFINKQLLSITVVDMSI